MIGICEECGIEAELDKHHRDKDHKNNDSNNIRMLCRWCHRVADGRQSRRPVSFEEVKRQYFVHFPRV